MRTSSIARRRAARYPTKAEITRALEAARQLDLLVGGFEVGPRGTIRVFILPNNDPQNPFDEWKLARAKAK